MKAIAKLKDDARKHEQKEEWDKAITAYLQVLKLGEQGDGAELDLPLYNRVGDLYVRLGRPMDAVTYYEQAADRYAEAGLYNNAIALCNKALRYDNSRLELMRKLGSFSASQGFYTDARRYYLEYAEKSIKRGAVDEAFAALSDYADVNDEPDVRELLARQLAAHGRKERALEEFKRAYGLYVATGQQSQADTMRAEILQLDPSADVSGTKSKTHTHARGLDALPGYAEDDVLPAVAEEIDDLPAIPKTLEIESSAVAGAEEATREGAEFGTIRLDSFGGDAADESHVEPLDIGLESTFGAAPEEVEEADTAFDLPGFGDEPASAVEEDEAALGLPTFDTFEAETNVADDLPMIETDMFEPLPDFESVAATEDLGLETTDFGDVAPLDIGELERDEIGLPESEPLPMLDVGAPVVEDDAVAELPAFEEEVIGEEPLPELPAFQPEGMEFEPYGHVAEVESEAEEELAAEAEPEAKAEPLPDWVAEVEAATHVEPEPEVEAERIPEPVAAMPAPPPPPPVAVEAPRKPSNDYVDLAALLGEDDDEAQDSTRFVVAEKAPTGDEEQDFADMLAQFKARVAESISQEDAGSHYDLGIAFKEMGLIDEAIGEFQTAMRAGQHKLKVYEELGSCFVMKQQYSIAITILNRAQQMPHNEDTELLGVFYNLGRAYEELGQRAEAREAYEKIVAIDIGFQDTTTRLARL